MTTSSPTTSTSLEQAFISLHQLLRQQAAYIQKTYQISHLEMDLINYVESHGPQKMKDISDHFHVKLSTLTSIIDKAERKRILKRVASKEDRRVVYLDITKKGKNIHAEFQAYLHQATEKISQTLEADTFSEFAAGIDTLSKVELT